jgi:thiamine biosynthesis lipoprotein
MRLVLADLEGPAAIRAASASIERVEGLERVFSRRRPDSELAGLARFPAGRRAAVSSELWTVLARAWSVCRASDGAFNPAFRSIPGLDPPLPDRVDLCDLFVPADGAVIPGRPGLVLDLDGIAKGWIVGEAAAVLSASGSRRFLVQIGGDTVCRSGTDEPWTVGIRDPAGPDGQPLAVLFVQDEAVFTSGGYERRETFAGVPGSHVRDPATGGPAESFDSVTIAGPDPGTADALAKAVMVLGPDRGPAVLDGYPGYRVVGFARDGRVVVRGFRWPEILFL